jgi:cell division protein FtsB
MRNFQQKRNWRNIIESKPVLILLGILILFFAWNILGFWNKMRETEKNKKTAEEEVVSLEQQKEKLSSGLNSLNTDEGKEKIFRENFGLAKDGEDEIVIVEDQNPPIAPAPASSGFWGFFKNIFK